MTRPPALEDICIRFTPKDPEASQVINIPEKVRNSLVLFLNQSPVISVRKTAYQAEPDERRRSRLTSRSGYFSLLLDVKPGIDAGQTIDVFIQQISGTSGFENLQRT